MKNYSLSIFSSIAEIPRQQWDSVWTYPPEGYNFYLSQEKSNIEGFEFLYIVIRDHDLTVLIAPVFTADFNFHLALDGFAQNAVRRVQQLWPEFLVVRTLFCGALTAEKAVIAIHPDYLGRSDLFAAFDSALLTHAKAHRIKMITFKDILETDAQQLAPLLSLGYSKSAGLPMTTLPIDFESEEEYFAKLSPKARKNIRRKVKEAAALGGVTVQEVKEIDDLIDEIHALYLNVHHRSDLKFGVLTKDFFLNQVKYLPDEAIYFLYWIKQGEIKRLIGFNLCINRSDDLMDKFIGMDYDYALDFNLYFVSLLENIKWCIKNQKKFYVLNQGGYDVKARFGVTLQPMVHMSKMVNSFVNKAATLFTRP